MILKVVRDHVRLSSRKPYIPDTNRPGQYIDYSARQNDRDKELAHDNDETNDTDAHAMQSTVPYDVHHLLKGFRVRLWPRGRSGVADYNWYHESYQTCLECEKAYQVPYPG